jgi:hypothetical protein
MDLVDLRNSLALGRSVAYIADFLCRSEDEEREKIAELDACQGSRPQMKAENPRSRPCGTPTSGRSWPW